MREPFSVVQAVAVPMDEDDIDTDQIIPSRFMAKPRIDYGQYCFYDRRHAGVAGSDKEFVLNRSPYRNARIMVVGRNFGCGSSREHAVYTLYDYGIRAIIGPSFGEIFYINCFKNGLLPIVAPADYCQNLRACLNARPGLQVHVDLTARFVEYEGGDRLSFEIDAHRQRCLVENLDETEYTLGFLKDIEAYEARTQGTFVR